MDIHPILVHIPIAFLSIYALTELLNIFNRFRSSQTFFAIKSFLLGVGFVGSVIAASAGENAASLNRLTINRNLLHLHENYASLTQFIFGALVVIYLSMWITKYQIVVRVGNFFKKYYFLVIALAVVGLVIVSITGALGGALVFGTDAKDPFINFVVDKLCGIDCL